MVGSDSSGVAGKRRGPAEQQRACSPLSASFILFPTVITLVSFVVVSILPYLSVQTSSCTLDWNVPRILLVEVSSISLHLGYDGS